MAWNKEEWHNPTGKQLASRHHLSRLLCVLAGLVIVIGVITAWLLFFSAPVPVSTTEPVKIVSHKKMPKSDIKTTSGHTTLAPVKTTVHSESIPSLADPRQKTHKATTNIARVVQTKGKYSIFNFSCENEIARLLTMKPGTTLIGTPSYKGRFTKQFLKSLERPILTNADDSDEIRELKTNVIQAKADLKAAYDRGEDIEQIMLDSRKELQNLARYKRELKEMVFEYKKTEDVSDRDVEDYIQAANKLLEEKGIAPLCLGVIARKKLRMNMIEERKTQK